MQAHTFIVCCHLLYVCKDPFVPVAALYPAIQTEFDRQFTIRLQNLRIWGGEWRKLKKQLVMVETCLNHAPKLDEEKKTELINAIFAGEDFAQVLSDDFAKKGIVASFISFFDGSDGFSDLRKRAANRSSGLSDLHFLRSLDDASRYGGSLAAVQIAKAIEYATKATEDLIRKFLSQFHSSAKSIQRDACKSQIERVMDNKRQSLYVEWRASFLQELQAVQEQQKGHALERYSNQ